MLKILVCGDPHFKIDNIPEVNMFTERFENLAKEKKPDLCVILGDLLHTHERLHTIPLNKAYDLVRKMVAVCPTYVIVGNHDYIQNQQYLTANHWMNGMKEWDDVTVVDRVIHKTIKNTHLVFCPYVPPGRFEEALNTNEEDWKTADCIFAHQEFFGCSMSAITSVEGDKWTEDNPQVVSGHIHSRQFLQKNIYYTGSAMQHAFGESDKNVIPLLTFSGTDKYVLEEFDLKLPRKKIIHSDVASMEDFKTPETKDKIKITISGVYDEFKAFKKTKKYKELIKSGTKVVFKPKKLRKKKDEEKDETPEPIDESSFNTILSSLVGNEKNKYLYQAYELVVNDKKISVDDIFFPA